MNRIDLDFFMQDVLQLAPKLLGKFITVPNCKEQTRFMITEVEAYRGEEDLACHAAKGRTHRTEIMYHRGGYIYVYLIYGMYWMLNIVAGQENDPQAVLIRGVSNCSGPGKVGRLLGIDKSYYGEDLTTSKRIWLEGNNNSIINYSCSPRIGIDYAGNYWKNKLWRFHLKDI